MYKALDSISRYPRKRWFFGTHLILLSKLDILSFTGNSCVYLTRWARHFSELLNSCITKDEFLFSR